MLVENVQMGQGVAPARVGGGGGGLRVEIFIS